MALNKKFYRPGISAIPSMKGFTKTLNVYTLFWLFLSLAFTILYGYYFERKSLAEGDYLKWSFDLIKEGFIIAIIVGLLVLYIHDKLQKDNPVQRLFPILIWGRKLLVQMGPLLRQYLFLNDQEETPYNRITRNWVYESSRGVRNTIGFGSQIDMDKVGTTLIMPATFTNLASKTGDETGQKYKKVIGLHTGVEPVTLNHFVNISAMSYGALSFRAHAA
ncbi:MAG: hypothetical protein OEY51_12900, partial [Cyclobacteriaceae bacterium]|nr:hypothetical protein [Cyclobacteriaceae bacterium]